ncbi:type IV secretion system DNA-binding domain-containing protein, partial [Orientia tsutsugamushi]|uniref:type IV secretion system DNA-binding domain-containing protein n=1 Tax=Orientia tsutsugamushi TaxID=784 RepID=UPI002F260423
MSSFLNHYCIFFPLFIYYFLYSLHISILCTYFLRSCYIIKLIHTIIYSDNRQFAKAFRNTAVSGIISESALETSAGIQSTLGKNITSLQYLKPGGSFSIKEWFSNSNETGWLFITA